MNLPGIILTITTTLSIASPALHAEDAPIITPETVNSTNAETNDPALSDQTMQINSQIMASTPPVTAKALADKKPDMAVYCREHTC